MRRIASTLLVALLTFLLGTWVMHRLDRPRPAPVPETPLVIERMREVARLETLDISVYKKISFSPDVPPADSIWEDLFHWVKENVRPSRGKAIVFAQLHLGLSLAQLDEKHLRIRRSTVEMILPPVEAHVELRPGETEVIDSNLDSQETAALLEHARQAFEQEANQNIVLQEKARQAARRAIQGLLMQLGFQDIQFVDSLPSEAGAS